LYFNTYIQQIKRIFNKIGIKTIRLLSDDDPKTLIQQASGIVIGGGDLSALLTGIVNYLDDLNARIQSGVPFLAWNEGSVAASPYYLLPPNIPVSSRCIGAIDKQIYCHYADSTANRNEITNFFINHLGEQPPIEQVICTKITPGGSGVRLEDTGSGLLYSPINNEAPMVFEYINRQLILL
jgi:hypothetical protein